MLKAVAQDTANILTNDIIIEGDAGNNELSLTLSADATTSDANSARIAHNTIQINDGGAAGDMVTLSLLGQTVTDNNINIVGGLSADDITVNITASYIGESGAGNENTLAVDGGSGNDTINLNLLATNSTTTDSAGIISNNDVTLDGGAGDDSLKAVLKATSSFTSGSGNVVNILGNNVRFTGDGGADLIDLDINATVANSSTARIGSLASANLYNIDAGTGNDTINIDLKANHTGSFIGTAAAVSGNLFGNVNGGSGDDSITLNLNATAASGFSVFVRNNTIDVQGGVGQDTINVNLDAAATDDAMIVNNSIYVVGGGSNNELNVSLNAQVTKPTATNATIANNVINIGDAGTGGDTITLSMIASDVHNNLVSILGGTATDDIDVTITADDIGATGGGNNLTIAAGSGDDNISLQVMASGLTQNISNNGVTIDAGAGSDTVDISITASNINNNLTLLGGAGDDVFNLTANGTGTNNTVFIDGGSGDDEINFAGDLSATATYSCAAKITFQYNATGDLGDTINGLTAGDQFIFNFDGALFGGFTGSGALNTTAFTSNTQGAATNASHRFIYDTVAMKLLYDADGTGTGAAEDVATFDADLAIMASDIKSTGGIGP